MSNYLYRRVSTDSQGNSGEGLQVQQTDADTLAQREGWTIDQVIDDVGVSRDSPPEKRPGLSYLVSILKPGDRVIIQKRDRLGEGFVSLLIERELKKLGVRLYSAEGFNGDSPQDKFCRAVLDAASELEHGFIRMRTRLGLNERKKKGQTYCRRLYGWKTSKGHKMVPIEDEQQAIHLMQTLRTRGESYSAIARTLDAKGIPAPCHGKKWRNRAGSAVVGTSWRHGTVKSILDRVEVMNGSSAAGGLR